jgi:glycosyltransferase EpsD
MTGEVRKVLFTSHVANFQKFNRPFMRMLKEQGYEVHYASDGEEKILDCDKEFIIPFERSPFKFGNINAYFKLKKIIDSEKYDLIHTHTPMGGVVTRLAARNARKMGTKVLYTAHGFHFFKGAPLLNWIIYYPIEKIMARHTDKLITINNEDFELASKKFKTEVHYVPGVGIDSKRFDISITDDERIKIRNSIGLNESDFVLLYPAELNKNKNQILLIKAMVEVVKIYPNIKLLLPGKDSLNGFHEKVIQKMGLSSNVILLGYRNDISNLLKITNLSISTSLREGLPVNIMEAMYLKLPIVVTDCRGNRDLVEDGVTGYIVDRFSKDALAEKIKILYKNADLRLEFGTEAGIKTQDYRIDNIITKMKFIYERVV